MGRASVGREQWLAWVAEQAESGVSVKRFCDERQISLQSFYNWRRKSRGCEEASANAFVPVSIAEDASNSQNTGLLEIDLPCGAKIRVPQSEEPLRQVLRVLLELGSQR